MKSKLLLRVALLSVVLGVGLTSQLQAYQQLDCIDLAEFWCSAFHTESAYVGCWDSTYFWCMVN